MDRLLFSQCPQRLNKTLHPLFQILNDLCGQFIHMWKIVKVGEGFVSLALKIGVGQGSSTKASDVVIFRDSLIFHSNVWKSFKNVAMLK